MLINPPRKEAKLKGVAAEPLKRSQCAPDVLVTESLQTFPDDHVVIAGSGWELIESAASGFGFEYFEAPDLMLRNTDEEIFSLTGTILFQPVPEKISREQRNLLLYCKVLLSIIRPAIAYVSLVSQHIAIEMIAFDGLHNGWRHLILPLAYRDDLVRNAVLATATAHQCIGQLSYDTLHTNRYTLWHPKSSQMYARAIRGLQERQEFVHGDQFSKYSILVTILVLLTAVMVTGCSDFPVLFRMLESAVNAMGGKYGLGEGELTEFIMRQVHK